MWIGNQFQYEGWETLFWGDTCEGKDLFFKWGSNNKYDFENLGDNLDKYIIWLWWYILILKRNRITEIVFGEIRMDPEYTYISLALAQRKTRMINLSYIRPTCKYRKVASHRIQTSINQLQIPSLTLYTSHSTLYTPHSTLYALHSAFYTLRFALGTPHTTLSTLHSTRYTVHFALYTPDSWLHTLHSIPQIWHFTLHTPHSTLYTWHSTRYIPHTTLHYTTLNNLNFTLYTCTLRLTLHTRHSTLYILHFTL